MELKYFGMEEQSFEILSSKKLRKEVASSEGESVLGSDLGMFRPSRESRVPQSFLGELFFTALMYCIISYIHL